ncbi:hypothetical protein V1460_31275 [Streptomyces sp. SCSIO 30461]|uniref:hypothetical protein n=1 Tax=Streptomyces sp. SCSIO 30461 TaxID=3118085 RepID=UPI0030CE6488
MGSQFTTLRVIGAVGGLLMLASTAGPVYAAQDGGRTATDCESRAGSAASGAYVLDAEMSGFGGSRGPLIGLDCGGRQYGSLGSVQAARQEGEGDENPKPQQSWSQNKTWEQDEKKTGGGDEKKNDGQDRKKQYEKPSGKQDEKKGEGRDKKTDGGGGRDGRGDDSGDEPDSDKTPYAPVRAGGGGTATSFAADGSGRQGPGTTHTVVGLALAAVAAATIAFRGFRRRRANAADKD